MRKLFNFLILALLCVGCTKEAVVESYEIVPEPLSVEMGGGYYTLDKSCVIVYGNGDENPDINADMARNASFLQHYLLEDTGIELKVRPSSEISQGCVISLELEPYEGERLSHGDSSRVADSYELEISDGRIAIRGYSPAGVFYGIQTLRKIISVPCADDGKPYASGAFTHLKVKIACGTVKDMPRFQYRGMHLDVARHMFPLDFIKRYIDLLALHNINVFHWHISDDQGWRIEIKSRPELTEKGAYRSGTVIKKEWGTSDSIPYGGYYTQQEAREIVKYAAERYITVSPEIDMPGHMLAALTAYPELGCTGGPYEVWTRWGVADDVLCVGKDETFDFLEDVFTEIMDIFPSKYIHIGGDECPKIRWESCPVCQAKIKELGLKDDAEHTAEEKLQSYAVERIERFINSKGRSIIGWDEILEGGLAPNATVMSWTGTEGGRLAAHMGHDVIMVPASYFYLNFHQSDDVEHEPFGIGGYVPIEKTYSFDPIPDDLKGTEKAKHIIGVQANLWTEYIKTTEHAEYMLLPRLAAVSEVQWSAPENRDFDDFSVRLRNLVPLYDLYGCNYALRIYDVRDRIKPEPESGKIQVSLYTLMGGKDIYYTLDGSSPLDVSTKSASVADSALRYEKPLVIDSDCVLRAVSFSEKGISREYVKEFTVNKATARKIESLVPVSRGGGVEILVNGVRGKFNYESPEWIAYYADDMKVLIDLGSETEISKVAFDVLVSKADWIFDAREIMVEVSSDGENYAVAASKELKPLSEDSEDGVKVHELSFAPLKARYVRLTVKPEYSIPDWHSGKGNPSFVFIDEISVN